MPNKEVPKTLAEAQQQVPAKGFYLTLKAKYGAMFEAMGRVE